MDKTIWDPPWFLASQFPEAMDYSMEFLLQTVSVVPVTAKRQ